MGPVLKKAKIPIIILVVLIVGFFAYNTMFKKTEDEKADAKTSLEKKKSPNQEFLPLLNLIKNVDFDDRFFADVVFRSLIDFSEPVREEQSGRDNPFAPGIVSSFANTSGTGINFGTEQTASTTLPAPTATSTPPSTNR